MDLQLNGKTAVVTGGSKGIGKATALRLAHEAADVAILARDKPGLEATAAEIAGQTGRRIIPVAADTGDDAAVRAAIGDVLRAFGRIDILVNGAARLASPGEAVPGLDGVSADRMWEEINVKVLGYVRTAREVVPHMKAQGWGRIINISGLAARSTGSVIGTVRNISVAALTKNLADDLAGTGINVVCVHPGLTATERTPDVLARTAAAQGLSLEDAERRLAANNLLGRLVTAADVADVIAFIASPRGVAINGDAIPVGGGTRGAIHY